MKTSLAKFTGAGFGLLLSVVVSTSVHAGPGPQYWQGLGKAKEPATAQAKPAATTAQACPGAAIVPMTEMKPSWSNGRGPLTDVRIGAKTVCHMCPVTVVVTTNDWPSHRGPLTRRETIVPGAAHTCTANCGTVAVK